MKHFHRRHVLQLQFLDEVQSLVYMPSPNRCPDSTLNDKDHGMNAQRKE